MIRARCIGAGTFCGRSTIRTDEPSGEAPGQGRRPKGEVAQGKRVTPQAERLRFENLAEDFRTDYRINRKRSLDKAERSVRHLARSFGGMRAREITTDRVRAFIQQRQKAGVSNAEINRELAALKRMFNLALRAGRLFSKPYIPSLHENNVRKGFFEEEAFRAILAELPNPLKPVVLFDYYCGWREEEVLGLTWRQVDLEAGTVRLEPGATKNQDGRLVVLPTELHVALREQRLKTSVLERMQGQIIPWVSHRNGKQVRDFRTAWQSACRRVGQPGWIMHDFRRTAARNLVRAGIPERITMMITGHKTRSVFDRYHIVSEGDLREAARKLSGTAMLQ
jgi:integrase